VAGSCAAVVAFIEWGILAIYKQVILVLKRERKYLCPKFLEPFAP